MKNRLTAILTLGLMAGTLTAGTVKLGWDPSITPDVEYIVHASTNLITETNKTQSLGRRNVGTNLTAELHNLPAGTYYFAVTALKGGLESDLSNVISGEIPNAPGTPALIPLNVVTNSGSNIFFLMQ